MWRPQPYSKRMDTIDSVPMPVRRYIQPQDGYDQEGIQGATNIGLPVVVWALQIVPIRQ
jgi:hypothetical protein